MADIEYDYTKTPVAPDRLELEIRSSSIVTALSYIAVLGSALSIFMKAELSSEDMATLDSIVAAHTGEPLSDPPVPKDDDGSPIIKTKTTRTGWHFEPRSLDFYTAKFKSLYNRKHNSAPISDGTDYGDAWLKFFDSTDAELTQAVGESDADFQTRLTANCVKTFMEWQPQYDMDIIGAIVMVKNPPVDPAYLWVLVAPDLTEAQGGSISFISGGWNLAFLPDKSIMYVNGRGVKSIAVDNVYNTNKLRLICKHSVGDQIGIQMIYEHFKA